VLEYVDHLHEHFLYPCSINERGRYNVPNNPVEGYRLRYVLAHRESRAHYTFLFIASRCTGQASQSMSGRMGHTGQKRGQRQNDMRGSGRVEEVLVVRKTGNYVTHISAHVLYVHMQSTNRPRESRKRRPRKESKLEAKMLCYGWPRAGDFRPLCTRAACSTEGDEGDLSEALHVRGKSCELYPIFSRRVFSP
jgi:hypothetical protein